MKIKNFILRWVWLLPLLIWFALTVHAKLSDETNELVDDLRYKHYSYGTLYCPDTSIISWEPTPIELVDIPLNVLMQVKGWEVLINDECYYILLVEKEEPIED